MDAIITAATVMAMYFNSVNSNGGRYVYNADIENGRVETISVYDNKDKYLSQKLQYNFLYDSQERLKSKEVLKWSRMNGSWEPAYRMDYTYTDTGYVLERREWDASAGLYCRAEEKMEYAMVLDNVVAVSTYKWSDDASGFVLADNVLVMDSRVDGLIAAM